MEPWNQKCQIAQEYGLLPADARQQLTRNQLSSVVREGTEAGATVMEQGVNLLANFPLSSPFFFFTTEICGRPRKQLIKINFAGKPVLKIILYRKGLTQGYSTYGGSK